MKSVIVSDMDLPNKIADDLLGRKPSPFKKRELEGFGFEIYAVKKADKTEVVVLKVTKTFLGGNPKFPQIKVQYEEKLLTIGG